MNARLFVFSGAKEIWAIGGEGENINGALQDSREGKDCVKGEGKAGDY